MSQPNSKRPPPPPSSKANRANSSRDSPGSSPYMSGRPPTPPPPRQDKSLGHSRENIDPITYAWTHSIEDIRNSHVNTRWILAIQVGITIAWLIWISVMVYPDMMNGKYDGFTARAITILLVNFYFCWICWPLGLLVFKLAKHSVMRLASYFIEEHPTYAFLSTHHAEWFYEVLWGLFFTVLVINCVWMPIQDVGTCVNSTCPNYDKHILSNVFIYEKHAAEKLGGPKSCLYGWIINTHWFILSLLTRGLMNWIQRLWANGNGSPPPPHGSNTSENQHQHCQHHCHFSQNAVQDLLAVIRQITAAEIIRQTQQIRACPEGGHRG